MTRRFASSSRRRLYGVLVVTLLALGIGVSQGLASASGSSVTVPVQKHNANCGVSNGNRYIGDATFSRSGSTLSVKVALTTADPGSTYYLYLYDGACTYLDYLGKFKVDSSGHGSKVGVSYNEPKGDYFIDAYNSSAATNKDNDSLIAHV